MNQQLMLLLLEKLGYRADVAANGVEALEALGAAALRRGAHGRRDAGDGRARGHPADPRSLAARAAAAHRRRHGQRHAGRARACIQAGMDDYIAKPIRLEELSAALAGVERLAGGAPPIRAVDAAVIRKLATSLGERGRASVDALIGTFLGHVPDQMRRSRARWRATGSRRTPGGAHAEVERLHVRRATVSPTSAGSSSRRRRPGARRAGDLVDRIADELARVTGELERIREELRT